MENSIIYDGKELKWEYKTCPCLECPIYPTRKEWEEEAKHDARKDKCYYAHCTYGRKLSHDIAQGLYVMMNCYHCDDCDIWTPKENEGYCSECGSYLI